MTSHAPRPVWVSLAVLAALSLGFGYAALRTGAPEIADSGPVVAVPANAPPTPLPDVKPQGPS